jgi:membrane protein insertase Oxa1/YidC/SpoIIIJ
MANFKFVGHATSFFVIKSNYSNYFNHFYYGINALLEALTSSGPLTVLQFFCIKENSDEENYKDMLVYIMCVVFSFISFVFNFGYGIYLLKQGISLRKDRMVINRKMKAI